MVEGFFEVRTKKKLKALVNAGLSASFIVCYRFLKFLNFRQVDVPWNTLVFLRFPHQNPLENRSMTGATQFCPSDLCQGDEKSADNTSLLARALKMHRCKSVGQNRHVSLPCMPYELLAK